MGGTGRFQIDWEWLVGIFHSWTISHPMTEHSLDKIPFHLYNCFRIGSNYTPGREEAQ
jgi:hypothetical protein